MNLTRCPDRDVLSDYCVGRLSAEQLDEIASHIETCEECQAEMITLEDAGDTFVSRLRAAGDGSYLNEPMLEVAMGEAIELPARPATRPDPTQSFVPRELGEYELLEELGRGGMGQVYKARHTKLDRVVAVKILSRGRLEDPRATTRFEREMRAIGRLNHPHVVHAYDAREIDQMPVLIMEFVDGMDLEELARRLGRLPINDACEIVRQAALGLQFAHEHGLVHRDVKPSNLILARDGRVKVLDLGLARFSVEPIAEEMTHTGQMMGTADYVAPEQVEDSRIVDIRADIYSLGCTLYRLLAGHAPYSGPEFRGTLDKLHAHVHRAVPAITQFVPGLPAELATILDRMLAKLPEDRFDTPAEVARALEPWSAGADAAALVAQAERAVASPQGRSHVSGVADSSGSRPAQAAPQHERRRARPWIVVGVLLCMMAASFAAGVIITIYRDGRLTRLDVPEGSDVRISPDGDVDVTLPSVSTSLQTLNRLKTIGVAMHMFHDQHHSLPHAVCIGPDGETPHSWRVALLPFLGHQELYDQYRRDEPWDSPHNQRLLESMPDVYRAPQASESSTETSVFALVGPETVFPALSSASRFATITDGTSRTILLVRAKRAVPWTKPEDITYSADQPLPALGGYYENGFHAIFADGAVRFLPSSLDEPTVRALISRAGGEPVSLPPPVTPRPMRDDVESVELSRDEGFPPPAATPQIADVDFLIAPVRRPSATAPGEPDSNAILSPRTTISEAEAEWHIQHLQQHGPDRALPGSAGYHPFSYEWFELAQPLPDQSLVTAEYRDKSYVLLSTRMEDVLVDRAGGGPAWGVEEVKFARDDFGHPSIAIQLDHAGGEALSTLTRNHLGGHLAILAGNRVLAAPRVITTVGRSLTITGAFTDEQVRQMFQLLAPANDNDE